MLDRVFAPQDDQHGLQHRPRQSRSRSRRQLTPEEKEELKQGGLRERQAVRRLAEERRLKLTEWCRRAGVSEGTLRHWLEDPTRTISTRVLRQLAQAENMTLSQLLGEVVGTVPIITEVPLCRGGKAMEVFDQDLNAFDVAIATVHLPLPPGQYVALQVLNDAVSRRVPVGGYAVINRQQTELIDDPARPALYLLRVEDELVIRAYVVSDGIARFEADSYVRQYAPIYLSRRLRVLGKVVLVFMCGGECDLWTLQDQARCGLKNDNGA